MDSKEIMFDELDETNCMPGTLLLLNGKVDVDEAKRIDQEHKLRENKIN
ncbi:hypothetical protein KHS38_11890 [Mucilaginibacter sp. Bleaf8]|nr:hypothetical protein [Mucilaginibacter sp. Bleaf8]MBS7565107.1 hypothetical protein [Mucilaginibacter sp. Bleaf8]